MKELINTFLDYLTVERGLSKNTMISYKRDLDLFADYLNSAHTDSWSKVKRDNISSFMMYQKDRGLSTNSISRSLAAIRMLFKF